MVTGLRPQDHLDALSKAARRVRQFNVECPPKDHALDISGSESDAVDVKPAPDAMLVECLARAV